MKLLQWDLSFYESTITAEYITELKHQLSVDPDTAFELAEERFLEINGTPDIDLYHEENDTVEFTVLDIDTDQYLRINQPFETYVKSKVDLFTNRFIEELKSEARQWRTEAEADYRTRNIRQTTLATYDKIKNLQKDMSGYNLHSYILESIGRLMLKIEQVVGIPFTSHNTSKGTKTHRVGIRYNPSGFPRAKIIKVYNKLIEEKFIEDAPGQETLFLNLFLGDGFKVPEKKIKWHNERALRFFIDKLEGLPCEGKTNIKMFTLPPNQWMLVKSAFMKPSGKDFKSIETNKKLPSTNTQRRINSILSLL